MPRTNTAQLNVRSDFARARALELARRTGKTTTQVVEDALRVYQPPEASNEAPQTGLVERGPLLVFPAGDEAFEGADIVAMIDADRDERADCVLRTGLSA